MERNLEDSRGLIGGEIQDQINAERQKWRSILIRILHVLKFLAVQNLAQRVHREDLELRESTNVGNFVGALTLLSHFDPLMSNRAPQHLLDL